MASDKPLAFTMVEKLRHLRGERKRALKDGGTQEAVTEAIRCAMAKLRLWLDPELADVHRMGVENGAHQAGKFVWEERSRLLTLEDDHPLVQEYKSDYSRAALAQIEREDSTKQIMPSPFTLLAVCLTYRVLPQWFVDYETPASQPAKFDHHAFAAAFEYAIHKATPDIEEYIKRTTARSMLSIQRDVELPSGTKYRPTVPELFLSNSRGGYPVLYAFFGPTDGVAPEEREKEREKERIEKRIVDSGRIEIKGSAKVEVKGESAHADVGQPVLQAAVEATGDDGWANWLDIEEKPPELAKADEEETEHQNKARLDEFQRQQVEALERAQNLEKAHRKWLADMKERRKRRSDMAQGVMSVIKMTMGTHKDRFERVVSRGPMQRRPDYIDDERLVEIMLTENRDSKKLPGFSMGEMLITERLAGDKILDKHLVVFVTGAQGKMPPWASSFIEEGKALGITVHIARSTGELMLAVERAVGAEKQELFAPEPGLDGEIGQLRG
jgi:hypothetical protein